ncbi:MAG: hypothetical protein LBK75_11245 [Oscillospiraceae bacterium]|nr:hypothetical protein [Oscillospiraceae bacterium]
MTCYKVYLTRSPEVASLLGRAQLGERADEDSIRNVTWGIASDNMAVPEIYQVGNLFCCVVEDEYGDDKHRPTYELTIC